MRRSMQRRTIHPALLNLLQCHQCFPISRCLEALHEALSWVPFAREETSRLMIFAERSSRSHVSGYSVRHFMELRHRDKPEIFEVTANGSQFSPGTSNPMS